MKKIIIAEKPSLMREIINTLKIKAFENFKQSENKEFYESDNYIATSVFGHIFKLKDFDDYEINAGKNMWKINNLPFFPRIYEYVLKADTKTRYTTLQQLTKRNDVDEIIHCGDPDREGQVLIDIVLEQLNCQLPVTRPFWKSLTPESIYEAITSRTSNDNFSNCRKEGLLRSYIDIDFGINLSRYATKKTNAYPALNVGRVIGAIVTEIYTREQKIKDFIPVQYFKVTSDENNIKLTSKNKYANDEATSAQEYASLLNSKKAFVSSIEQKLVKKRSPKLFSQTTLQAALNKRFGYSPEETLKLAQSLYEKQLATYPRTNTEYLSEGEKSSVQTVINTHTNADELVFKDQKSIFDDSKIEGHTAIIPTTKKPSDLSEKEENCYKTILNRFKTVFCATGCTYNQTTAIISCGETEDFTIKGEVVVSKGWQVYEPVSDKDKSLPEMHKDDVITVNFKPEQAETAPPKSYTVEMLGKWLQNPFCKEGETEDEEYKKILSGLEIGTEATRASILQKAQDKKYIKLEKSTYKIQDRGVFLVESCKALNINMDKEVTAQMGRQLKEVYKGKNDIETVLSSVRAEISDIIAKNNDVQQDTNNQKTVIGTCPLCGKSIYENKKAYGCSGYKEGCSFVLWKTIAGKSISAKQASDLLSGKTIGPVKGFKSKAGKPFSAKVKLKKDKSGAEFIFNN